MGASSEANAHYESEFLYFWSFIYAYKLPTSSWSFTPMWSMFPFCSIISLGGFWDPEETLLNEWRQQLAAVY